MNRLKLIAHKWYVAFVTFKSVMQYIFAATERIAGLKIIILSEADLDRLDEELNEEDGTEVSHLVDPKDMN